MNIETARQVYEAIVNTKLEQLKTDLFSAAVRYARIRVDWQFTTPEKRKEMEQTRGSAHNALIDACNILSRNMLKSGEDNAWRSALGDNRKEIGDFACYLHAIFGILAR
jgi:hypothetical protein